MITQIYHAHEWLYPDSELNDTGGRRVELACARGGRAATQLLIRSFPQEEAMRWTFSWHAPHRLADDELPIEAFRLSDVLVNENTGPSYSTVPNGTDAPYAARLAPFRVYDVLVPVSSAFIRPAGDTLALYVSWVVPTELAPGDYHGTLALDCGGDSLVYEVSLYVYEAVVPRRETLHTTNWHSNGNIASYHGLEEWSEDHWAMIGRYGEAMRRARQTHFIVGMDLIEATRDGTRYAFDFARAKRYIELFLSLGFSWIEGGHLACRTGWSEPTFVLTYDRGIEATQPEGFAFLAQFLPAWHAFLSENGWLDRIVQHVADEPIKESAADFRILCGIIRKLLPGVPLIEAIVDPNIEGSVDIWVPTNKGYDEHRAYFESLQRLGEVFWFYTCWNPGGYYLNRFLDISLLKTRYLHWGNYKYGLTGYLHWGFNQYLDGQDPFELTCPLLAPDVHAKRVPPGDTHIVYPGADGPLLSMRLEAMRAGCEDYELFRLLAASDKALADAICDEGMASFTDVSVDPDAFAALHLRLLEAASGLIGTDISPLGEAAAGAEIGDMER
ncbi:DUF4091 domain-containing protein [Paenibacillus methanolicus]|uniref:Uncharacterized protein DUF4091 n=1 Tax=Paenibacillus methanolicus TaxID=582686 RepID=A0A5S5CLS2_9BACL|nr:DUF4091 domain-containing protein [Paenibacillus methanolicus]TYP79797.1 uncharacterized protein DUF4091 [Paenibacillus methanolicus]